MSELLVSSWWIHAAKSLSNVGSGPMLNALSELSGSSTLKVHASLSIGSKDTLLDTNDGAVEGGAEAGVAGAGGPDCGAMERMPSAGVVADRWTPAGSAAGG